MGIGVDSSGKECPGICRRGLLVANAPKPPEFSRYSKRTAA